MMDERELRLECLRLAVSKPDHWDNAAAAVDGAKAFYEFVTGGKKEIPPMVNAPRDLGGYAAKRICANCLMPTGDCLCGDPRPVAS